MRIFPPALAALLLVALSSCSVLPEPQAVTVYLLPGAVQAPSTKPPVEWALRLATPQASQVLGSARIAVVARANQISGYKGARWSDPVPALLRDRLLDAFQADGRVLALSSEAKPLYADLLLVSELHAFQAEYREGGVQVSIRLDARLVRSASQRIVATRRFEVLQPVAGDQLAQVIPAFGQASDRLAAQLVDWTLEQGSASLPAR